MKILQNNVLMDEKDLVRRCRTGEPGARQEMYETYAGRVLAVCRRYFRESDRAQDLLHDTFLKAWDSLGSFHPRRTGSLGAWLSQIAAHLAVDELRRRKLLVQEDTSFAGLTEEPPVDETRLRQVPVEELIELIAALPEGYRAVFNLFCLDGLSHREIARLLGITEKTSQTQYLKARHKLAAMIAAKYGNDEKE
ncbi:MAG: sigma-70 family RNA polymerase sigma factor [Bacteroidales bacterium]|nr:sigma-70 family RNA polymerase sigma factor [Bacteroidales bacterium]